MKSLTGQQGSHPPNMGMPFPGMAFPPGMLPTSIPGFSPFAGINPLQMPSSTPTMETKPIKSEPTVISSPKKEEESEVESTEQNSSESS